MYSVTLTHFPKIFAYFLQTNQTFFHESSNKRLKINIHTSNKNKIKNKVGNNIVKNISKLAV